MPFPHTKTFIGPWLATLKASLTATAGIAARLGHVDTLHQARRLELPLILGRHFWHPHVPSGHVLLHDPKWLNLGKAKALIYVGQSHLATLYGTSISSS
jgi:hypothetical protein